VSQSVLQSPKTKMGKQEQEEKKMAKEKEKIAQKKVKGN
jgi:hypothetical protein